MQGLNPTSVAYLGTTSKTLSPSLRLAWAVLPGYLADQAEEAKSLLDLCSPPIPQHALALLLERGEYDRQVRRARAVYGRRRDALIDALRHYLPDYPVEGVAAGIHLLLRLPPEIDDCGIADVAAQAGVRVEPLSRYAHSEVASKGLVLGYGRIHEQALQPAIRILALAVNKFAGLETCV